MLFLGAAGVLGLFLTPRPAEAGVQLAALSPVLRDRRFMLFCLLASGNLIAFSQLYFIFPLALEVHEANLTGPLFAGVSIVTVTAQIPVHRFLDRFAPRVAVRLGFLSLLASFVLPATLQVAPYSILGSAVLLALGHLILTPTHQRTALRLMRDQRLRGVHLGLLATCGGVMVILVNTVLGPLLDTAGPLSPLPWLALAALMAIPAILLPARIPETLNLLHDTERTPT